jgi:hypothetical protein
VGQYLPSEAFLRMFWTMRSGLGAIFDDSVVVVVVVV